MKKLKIIPNTERVLVRLLQAIPTENAPVLIPGQLKAGENLLCGAIIHPGTTKFKKNQVVYYSEYSAAAVANIGAVLRGESTMGEAIQEKLYVVAVDDIMAYEEKVFPLGGLRKEKV